MAQFNRTIDIDSLYNSLYAFYRQENWKRNQVNRLEDQQIEETGTSILSRIPPNASPSHIPLTTSSQYIFSNPPIYSKATYFMEMFIYESI
ncbi:hypothetical protein RCL_jg15989.t1 [Rhizophagus clarus]|uniref:Uncharacterized protein n=1 Tax=Rhizophagus clarus TaxID=94130 RepID=A0A8H3LCS2_9GLOM|nr:hypothetical protein RCL_jg15989.t1 [Rhizophagus clarus]